MTAPAELNDSGHSAGLGVAEVLSRAADLIEQPGAWTQGWARVPGGHTTWSEDPHAVSFCAMAAISRAAGGWTDPVAAEARERLRLTIGLPADKLLGDDWNDAPGRTQAEVVAALRQAALQSTGGASD